MSNTSRRRQSARVVAHASKPSTYKFIRAFFRHDRRTAPKFGTHVRIETATGSHQKILTNPTPEGFRGLFIDVCGMFVGCLFVAWFKPVVDRKLLERLMSPSPKSQVMFASAFSWIGDFFSNFWDSYFSSYGEFVEFSLRFTAAVWAVAVCQRVHCIILQ